MNKRRDRTAASSARRTNAANDYTGEVNLTIPSLMEYVSVVRSVVSSTAQLHPGMKPARIEDLRVAVSEAITNAVRSHQSAGASANISVNCRVADDHIEIIVRDQGKGFDLDSLPNMPEPESPERLLHESGMGLRLMRMLADEAEIKPSASGTYVRLVFKATKRGRTIVGR